MSQQQEDKSDPTGAPHGYSGPRFDDAASNSAGSNTWNQEKWTGNTGNTSSWNQGDSKDPSKSQKNTWNQSGWMQGSGNQNTWNWVD